MSAAPRAGAVRLPPLPTVRDLVKLYRLRAMRQLSQNFLLDERITDRLVKKAGRLQDGYVCEVGPGPGSITRSILKQGPRHLLLVEKDPRFLPTLELLAESTAEQTKTEIAIGDIMSYNLRRSFPEAEARAWSDRPPNIHLIGNLPFSISTALVIKWLREMSVRESAWAYGRARLTLTFQQEVAERIVAPVTHRQRCRLSVMCQTWCSVQHRMVIPGTAFVPKPQVDVGVVTMTPLEKPLTDLPFHLVERVVRAVFNMRQKFCWRGASNLFPEEVRDTLTQRLFRLADMDPSVRPFQITTEEFARLCQAYRSIADEFPDIEGYDYRMCKKKPLDSADS